MKKRKFKLITSSPCKKAKINLALLLALTVTTATGCHYEINDKTFAKINKMPPSVIESILELEGTDAELDNIIHQFRTHQAKNATETLLDLNTVNQELQEYGQFIVPGMKTKDYEKMMAQPWIQINPTGAIDDLNIDLRKSYTFQDLEKFMYNLAKYEGIKLTTIGQSVEGRNIYSITLNQNPNLTTPTILLTGQVHAREFAGSIFILKQLDELIKKAAHDPYTKLLLENIKIEAVPLVNPDSREAIINGANVRTKANANGVDLNHNFPAVNGGQVVNGNAISSIFTNEPGIEFFSGYNLGSEPEVQALMKWFNLHAPYAKYFLDYHQQGRGIYTSKSWDIKTGTATNLAFREEILKHLNQKAKYKYSSLHCNTPFNCNGIGGSTTDYAMSVARGLKFNKEYGRMVLEDRGQEIPLIIFKDLNYYPWHEPPNKEFVSLTLEIGLGLNALGYDAQARNLIADEYILYNYNTLLERTIELALGPEKIESLKTQAKANTNLSL